MRSTVEIVGENHKSDESGWRHQRTTSRIPPPTVGLMGIADDRLDHACCSYIA